MTIALSSPGLTPAAPGFRVVRVSHSLRLEAAARLVGAAREDREKPRRFLQAASMHGIDLRQMWASVSHSGGAPRQVCLAVPGAGRAAMMFTSTPRNESESTELASVIDRSCDEMSGAMLAQALLEQNEHGARAAFVRAGFQSVGDLGYLRRPRVMASDAPDPTEPNWPRGVSTIPYRPEVDAVFLEALDRSYEATLDCPELCGLRDTRDVLDSHRATGRFDPNLWRAVLLDGRPHGALLLNPNPEQASIELVYLGVSPALRGVGIGSMLLAWGLALVRERPEPFVTCAVDRRNEPALRLYRRLGFAEFASRAALVRRTGAPSEHGVV